MPDTTSYANLVGGWTLTISPCCYLLACILLAIVVRLVHSTIKVYTIGVGEESEDRHKELLEMTRGKRWWASFNGCNKFSLTDRWLGLVVGFVEITVYPVLIFTNNLPVIGGWLAIKTAGGWDVWKKDRIAFNSFLVANLVNLGIAWFIITLGWITRAP